MIAGRRTDLSRIAGFSWVLEWEDWSGPSSPCPEDSTEVYFISLSPTSINGGEYFIYHESTNGRWFAYEQGGHGPHVWDREVSHGVTFPSPLAAMMACRRDYIKAQKEMERQERELERFAEEERQRAKWYEEGRKAAEQSQYHYDLEAKDWDGL